MYNFAVHPHRPQQKDDGPNLLAKEELNLLARLMGSMKAEDMAETETGFRINLFMTDGEEGGTWGLFAFSAIKITVISQNMTFIFA